MAIHSSTLAWRIPGMGEPGGLPSMGSHRVGHDWSDLAAAAGRFIEVASLKMPTYLWLKKWTWLQGSENQSQKSLFFYQIVGVDYVLSIFPDIFFFCIFFASHSQRIINKWSWGLVISKSLVRYVCVCVYVYTHTGADSVQLSSVAQSCLTLCSPMNFSTSGYPVHHQIPDLTQTHVHRGGRSVEIKCRSQTGGRNRWGHITKQRKCTGIYKASEFKSTTIEEKLALTQWENEIKSPNMQSRTYGEEWFAAN